MYALDNTDYVPGWGYEFHDPSYAYPPDRVLRAGDKMADLSFFKTGLLWNYLSSETVYRCPSYTSRKYKKGVVFWGPTDGKIPVWSYAENGQAAMSCQSMYLISRALPTLIPTHNSWMCCFPICSQHRAANG